MIRVTVEINDERADPQGVKEMISVALERLGDVRVVDVAVLGAPEQMKMEG